MKRENIKTRSVALKILNEVIFKGAYSNIALNRALNGLELSNEQRGQITGLVYGVIERRLYIEYIINKYSKIKTKKMNSHVYIALALGVYQLLFDKRVEEHAAINECVGLIKDKRNRGFVNAILRTIQRASDEALKINTDDRIEYLSIFYSCSRDIVELLCEQYTIEEVESFLKASLCQRPMYIYANPLKADPETLADKLRGMGAQVHIEDFPKGALSVEYLRDIRNNPSFKNGEFHVQDISSMLPVLLMNPKERSKILDVCAAPGGKSILMSYMAGEEAEITACDIYEHKLELINESARRLSVKNIKTALRDASEQCDEYVCKFDYVLCDAPCSGLGIISRKPEIKYKSVDEISSLPELQLRILTNCASYVKDKGELIYSTCTLNKRENEDVVREFLKSNPGFRISDDFGMLDSDNNDLVIRDGFVYIFPRESFSDGFLCVKLIKI